MIISMQKKSILVNPYNPDETVEVVYRPIQTRQIAKLWWQYLKHKEEDRQEFLLLEQINLGLDALLDVAGDAVHDDVDDVLFLVGIVV